MRRAPRPKPRYLELAEHFTAAIARGDYAVGSLLPTELEICERFSVSRHTARAALSQLIAAGLVLRRPGAGTRVLMPREAMRYQHEVDTVEDLLQYGNQTRLEVRSARRERADAELALQLGARQGSEVVMMEALRFELGAREAIAWTDLVFPLSAALPLDQLLDLARAPRAVARLLDPRLLAHVEQVFSAASFGRVAAKALAVRVGSPAMRVARHYRDASGRVLAYAVSLHPAGRFSYRMVLSRRGA